MTTHRMKNYFVLLALTLVFAAVFMPFVAEWAQAQGPTEITTGGNAGGKELINPNLPSIPGLVDVTDPNTGGPAALVSNLYRVGIWIGALLAFGAITYGGFLWAMPKGSTENAGEGRMYVTNAVLGLIMLFLIYLLVYVVNPDYTNLRFPRLDRLRQPAALIDPTLIDDNAAAWACQNNETGRVAQCFVDEDACEDICEEKYDEPSDGLLSNFECVEMTGKQCKAGFAAAASSTKGGQYGFQGVAVPAGTVQDTPALRARLEAKGIRVNKSNCNPPAGTTSCSALKPGCTGCTSLDGLPERTIEGLERFAARCQFFKKSQCNIIITGGTETGHVTHRIGKPIVDLSAINGDATMFIREETKVTRWSHNQTERSPVWSVTYMWEDARGSQPQHWHLVF